MSLVSSDDASAVRVIPKVFADVPSATEVQQYKSEAQNARRGRSTMLIFVVLLFGMLLAAGAFVVYQHGLDTSGMQKMKQDRDLYHSQRDDLQGQLSQLDRYRNLDRLQGGVSNLKGTIRQLMADPTLPAGYQRLLPAEYMQAYNQAAFDPTATEGALRAQSDKLYLLAGRLSQLTNRPPPAPPCYDPRGCH